jgi:hypothetical protein
VGSAAGSNSSAARGVAVDLFRLTDTVSDLLEKLDAARFDSGSFNPIPSIATSATGVNPVAFIQAAKVSLPSQAGTANLLNLLPPEVRQVYSEANSALLYDPATDEPREPAPRPVFLTTYGEYVKLIRRMFELKMVAFTVNPICVNGIFGVPKDGGAATRLIIDARPANALFKLPPHVELPAPDDIARIQLPSTHTVQVAKSDLDNYYHKLQCPEWLQPYFALPAIRAADVSTFVGELFGPDTKINPMCTTLPMGWSHSVYVAQTAHEALVSSLQALAMPAVDRVGATSAGFTDYNLWPGRILHSVYIDDVVWFGTDIIAMQRMQAAYVRLAASVGLNVKPSKLQPPTDAPVEVLGIEFDGKEHTYGLSAPKLEALIGSTCKLIADWKSSRGKLNITGIALAHIVGKWTWAMLPNRLLLSTFNSVYRFIEKADRRSFVLWPSVVTELGVAVGLAPLMFTRLSSLLFEPIIATDASTTGRGVVVHTPINPNTRLLLQSDEHPNLPSIDHTSEEIRRHQHQHQHQHVDNKHSPSLGGGNIPDSVHTQSIDDVNWVTIVSDRWRRSEHINILELRALDTAVKWVLSHPGSTGKRITLLTDSQVAYGAVRKGRSSAQEVLRRLRAIAALVLAGGLQLKLFWVPTNMNPADAASRT